MVIKLDSIIEGQFVLFDLDNDWLEPFKVEINGKTFTASSFKKLKQKIRGSLGSVRVKK